MHTGEAWDQTANLSFSGWPALLYFLSHPLFWMLLDVTYLMLLNYYVHFSIVRNLLHMLLDVLLQVFQVHLTSPMKEK